MGVSAGVYDEEDSSRLAEALFGGQLGVEDALAKPPNRLLDLSVRNRLLNYKYPKGRSFQFTTDRT